MTDLKSDENAIIVAELGRLARLAGMTTEEVVERVACTTDNLKTCRKCGGEMKPGIATGQTFTGLPDFPGDTYATTLNAGGPGVVVEAMKCSKCGWSVTK